MLADSPGVGESDVISSFILNYLARAFCFMYVLCTSSAGGIQPDRVRIMNKGYCKHNRFEKGPFNWEGDWRSPVG